MPDEKTMSWIGLLTLMVHGPESGAEPTLRGMVRTSDGHDASPPMRVWRDGGKLRVEAPDGSLELITDGTMVWSFRRGQEAPLTFPYNSDRIGFPGKSVVVRRDVPTWLGDDFTRPTGPARATRFLDRPAWEVELAPPQHKPHALQLVVDAETGNLLQQRQDAVGSVREWTELVIGEPMEASLFTWSGPLRLERDDRLAHRAEQEAVNARARDWFTAHVAALPLPVHVLASVRVHTHDPATGAFEASIEAGGLGTLARRPRSTEPWDLQWHEVQHRWSDDRWDWALSVYDTTFGDDGLAVLRQHLSGTAADNA